MIRRPRPERTRALCAALIVCFAAGQIVGAAHAAETAHAVCAEHGELIDLPGSPDTVAAPSSDRGEAAKLSDALGSTGDSHQHCGFASAFRHHGLSSHQPSIIGSAFETRPSSMVFICVAPSSRLALYQLAPKTSPPIAV